MFTKNYIVSNSSFSINGHPSITSLISTLQTSATDHSAQLGFPPPWFIENSLAWVLINWNIEFNHIPKDSSSITVNTWSNAHTKLQAHRSFLLTDNRDVTILEALSKWVLIDTTSRKISRSSQEIMSYYKTDKAEIFQDGNFLQNIPLEEHLISSTDILVTSESIDQNKHINNVVYIDWHEKLLSNILSQHDSISNLKVHYYKEAYEGDVLLHNLYSLSPSDGTKEFISVFSKKSDPTFIHCQISSSWRFYSV